MLWYRNLPICTCRSTNRELVIPSPDEVSDPEDSGSDEEEEEVEGEDADQSIDGQSGTSFQSQ